MHFFEKAKNGVRRRASDIRTEVELWAKSRVIHGPNEVHLHDDDCAVVLLVKNGNYYIETFLKHHLALGVKHVVIIDNGSSDNTVDIARGFPDVTIVSNSLPARLYESRLRSKIGRRVIRGGWLLFVDVDELFDYALSEGRQIKQLIRYNNKFGYTAMLTQMLDFYSPINYYNSCNLSYEQSLIECNTYTLDNMDSIEYFDRSQVKFWWLLKDNICEETFVNFKVGGLRREFFKENPFLSKHSLVRNLHDVEVMSHPHCASRVRCADVTGLLRHYKFAGPYIDRDKISVTAGTWDHGEDKKRLQRIADDLNVTITCRNPRVYEGTEALIDEGFLVCSKQYRAFMQDSQLEQIKLGELETFG